MALPSDAPHRKWNDKLKVTSTQTAYILCRIIVDMLKRNPFPTKVKRPTYLQVRLLYGLIRILCFERKVVFDVPYLMGPVLNETRITSISC